MRNNCIIILIITIAIWLSSCVGHERDSFKEIKISDEDTDSVTTFITYKNAIYCVPSPQLVNLYIKSLGIYPERSAINPISNTERYTTTFRKALNLGVFGADMGYMNVFTMADNTGEYLKAIQNLAADLSLGGIFNREFFTHLDGLKNNQDSLIRFLNSAFIKADFYLKDNSRQQVCALIVAGGWIECFYLLSYTYSKYKNKEVFEMLMQQKYILDNIIKMLAPYYESSAEIQLLTDSMVDLAYDFDALDFKYSYNDPIYKEIDGVVYIYNQNKIVNSLGNIDNIIKKIFDIRYKLIS